MITDLYCKPTDKHLYLQMKSEHPVTVKKAIPYGLGIQIKRICTQESDYQKNITVLRGQLRRRGYSGNLINRQFQKLDRLNRDELLTYKQRKEGDRERVPFVITYSHALPDVHKIVRKRLSILHRSERMKAVFPKPSIIAYKRGSNICDSLVHRKTSKAVSLDKTVTTGSMRCKKGCSVCPLVIESKVVTSINEDRTFEIKSAIDCETDNVVYAIHCGKCESVVYVGETDRRLKDRAIEHRSNIKTGKEVPVALHFNQVGHRLKDMYVYGIERVSIKNSIYRREREKLWIKLLKTEMPDGLNKKT